MEDAAHLCTLFVDHLRNRYAWLMGSFEMLAPMVKDKDLRDRLFKSNKNEAGRYVLRALFNSCVLDVHMLVNGREPTNPSILRLVRPFLPKNLQKNPRLLTQLAALHYPKDKELRRKFRSFAPTWIKDLLADWGSLRKATEDFDTLRKKWIAHHELEWDPNTQAFQIPKIGNFEELFPKLEQTVPIITRLVQNLSRLLTPDELRRKKFKREIREIAIAFWDLK